MKTDAEKRRWGDAEMWRRSPRRPSLFLRVPPSSLILHPSSFSSGRGVRPSRLFELHAPAQSTFCRDESRPESKDEGGRMKDEEKTRHLVASSSFIPHPSSFSLVPKEGLKPSTSGL